MDKPLITNSLPELCCKHVGPLRDVRVYKVALGGETNQYVVEKSPGRAALAVCGVSRVTEKELLDAAFEALNGEKVKQ